MVDRASLGTEAQLRDPNYTPPLTKAIPLGIQHVMTMFVSNMTPAIIVAGAAGFGFGSNSPDFPQMIYMIQMAICFAGVATLLQTIGIGPIGGKLPIVQGTSFSFLPIMIPLVAGKGVDGLAALYGGVIVSGIFHTFLGFFIGRLRFAFPPLITGLVVLMIGLALVNVGIKYAAGGVPNVGKPEFGNLESWGLALTVIAVTLGFKFYTRGMLSAAAVLIGLIAGYLVAIAFGLVNFSNIGTAAVFEVPKPFPFGVEFTTAAIVSFCLVVFASAIETVGDVTAVVKTGAKRNVTEKEIVGATFADGLGTTIAGFFGAFSNTSFSQNVGLVAITGVMSRHVVTIGAIFLILCGLSPKVGAVIATVPIQVLGGSVIVMFGMVCAAGVSMLSDVNWTRRNLVIFAISLSVGFGLLLVPEAVQHLPPTARIIMVSGILPAAVIAVVLNLILPKELEPKATKEISGRMAGHGQD